MHSSLRTRSALAILLLASLSAGCAAQRRQALLEERANLHIYNQPLASVWPHVLSLLKEKNYQVRTSGLEYELITEWIQNGPASNLGTVFSRYLVRGHVQPGGRCAVEFFRQDRTQAGQPDFGPDGASNLGGFHSANTGQRDGLIEWELLQRVDPEAAKAIEAEADKA